jgi:hypothetical protein
MSGAGAAFLRPAFALKTPVQPYFVNTWAFSRSYVTSASDFSVATIISRNSATQFTCQSGHGARIPAGASNTANGAGGAIVIKDDATGRYKSYGVSSVSGDVVTVYDTLPASISSCQQMFNASSGYHLSDYGYRGMGDYLCDSAQKWSLKEGTPLFSFYAPGSSSKGASYPGIYDLSGTNLITAVSLLGSASAGGFVTGTSDLSCVYSPMSANGTVTTRPLSQYLARGYLMQDTTAGKGMQITIPVNGNTGFLEFSVAGQEVAYNSGSLVTSGRPRVVVLADGASIFDTTYGAGELQFGNVEFDGPTNLTFQVMFADSSPSSILIGDVNVYACPMSTPKTSIFKSGDCIAFLGDSWTIFPLSGSPLLRADGSSSGGLQYFQQRVAARLAADGISVSTLNMGFGGQTSAWGRYWVNGIAALSPKPTHCVVNFCINDYVSSPAADTSSDTIYDFDPANQWTDKVQSLGGMRGATSPAEWYANIQYIATTLMAAGIRPVIMMPSWVANTPWISDFQKLYLARLSTGFYPAYANSGLTP